MTTIDAETLYQRLRDVCEDAGGTISDEADEMLADAARAIEAGSEAANLGPFLNVDPHEQYSCYTPDNNAFVARGVGILTEAIRTEQIKRSDLGREYEATLQRIAAHVPEVYDTEVRQAILHEVDKACADVGWRGIED